VLSEAGISDGSGALTQWRDVARVELRPLRQRLDLYDASGRRLLALSSELESFPAVQDQIVGHMQPQVRVPPCTIPLLAPGTGLPFAAFALVLGALWVGPRAPWPAAVFAAAGLLCGLLYLARRRRLEVGLTGVVLRKGVSALRVGYDEISAVRLQARPQSHGGVAHYLVLEREGSESVPIAGFRRGYHEAYLCLEAAWRAARGSAR